MFLNQQNLNYIWSILKNMGYFIKNIGGLGMNMRYTSTSNSSKMAQFRSFNHEILRVDFPSLGKCYHVFGTVTSPCLGVQIYLRWYLDLPIQIQNLDRMFIDFPIETWFCSLFFSWTSYLFVHWYFSYSHYGPTMLYHQVWWLNLTN